MGAKEYTFKNPEVTWASFSNPCYDPQEKYGDCPKTLLDVIQDERIPAKDRIWAFTQCDQVPAIAKRTYAVRMLRDIKVSDGKFVIDMIADPLILKSVNMYESVDFDFETKEYLESLFESAMNILGVESWPKIKNEQMQIIISMIEP